jgi:hypothetical protein
MWVAPLEPSLSTKQACGVSQHARFFRLGKETGVTFDVTSQMLKG